MKKLMYGILFLATVGIGFIGCKKQIVEIENKSTSEQNLVTKKSNFINPYDHVGQNLYSILSYLDNYGEDIANSGVYCPIEFSISGNTDYSTKTKMLNRIKQFALDNNLPIISDNDLNSSYSGFSDPMTKLNILVSNGDVSIDFKNKLLEFNGLLNESTTNLEMFNTSKEFEINISVSNLTLQVDELELLYSIVSGVKYTASYLIDNNYTSLPVIQSMPCGVAVVANQAAFVGLCMATGPIGWLVGGIGFACGVWGVLDAC